MGLSNLIDHRQIISRVGDEQLLAASLALAR
jgi:hypothetical protein